jgi:hypothetical protein
VIRIWGASDDLLEVDGDVYEEFSVYGTASDEPLFVAVSDGSLWKVTYDDDGCWRVASVVVGANKHTRIEADGVEAEDRADGTCGYSDVVTIQGDVAWVALAKGKNSIARAMRKKAAASGR